MEYHFMQVMFSMGHKYNILIGLLLWPNDFNFLGEKPFQGGVS
jgi:hypothetical protein